MGPIKIFINFSPSKLYFLDQIPKEIASSNKIEFTVDMRNPNDKLLTNIEMKINKFIKRLCKKENVNFKINKIVNFKSVNFDNKMNQIINTIYI